MLITRNAKFSIHKPKASEEQIDKFKLDLSSLLEDGPVPVNASIVKGQKQNMMTAWKTEVKPYCDNCRFLV